MGGKHESHLQSHLESSEEQLCRRFRNCGDSEKKWGVRVSKNALASGIDSFSADFFRRGGVLIM